MKHGPEKSDPAIVATKPANNAERSAAEPMERRVGAKGNASQQSTSRTQSRISVSQALERIRQRLAVTHPRWEPYAGKPHVRFCAGGAQQWASLPLQRREVIAGLTIAAAAWPMVGRAQQVSKPVIGFLSVSSLDASRINLAAFRQGLSETGFVEGRNVATLYRWADGQYDKLPAFAIDLAGRQVAVLVAAGGVVGALAAKAATSTIPIVFSGGSDPVAAGLVASLNRPGANVTGILSLASELTAKRLELLRELIPAATAVAVLHNPTYPESTQQLREIQDAAARTGHSIHAVSASTERDLDSVLPKLTNHRTDALVVTNDPFFSSQRQRLVTLVGRYAIPAIYAQRQYSEAGGLMSYGTNFAELFRQVGVYTGLILKGAKPENLPVMQPTKYEVVINLKTAKTLGLTVPPTLLARADEVIE